MTTPPAPGTALALRAPAALQPARPTHTALTPPEDSPLHPSRYGGPLRWLPGYPVAQIAADQWAASRPAWWVRWLTRSE